MDRLCQTGGLARLLRARNAFALIDAGPAAVSDRRLGGVYKIQILPPQPELHRNISILSNAARFSRSGLCTSGYHMGSDRDQAEAKGHAMLADLMLHATDNRTDALPGEVDGSATENRNEILGDRRQFIG